MSLPYGCCDALDLVSVGHIAELVLGPDFLGDLAQPLFAPRQQHEPPASAGERSCDRGADPARAARDDGEPGRAPVYYRQTLTLRRAVAEPRPEARTTRSRCGPRFAAAVFHVAV